MKNISVINLISKALNINSGMSLKYLSKFLLKENINDIISQKRSYQLAYKNKNKFLIQFLAFINREKLHYRQFDETLFNEQLPKEKIDYKTMKIDKIVQILKKNMYVQVEISHHIENLLKSKKRLNGKSLTMCSLETKNEFSNRQVARSNEIKPTIRKNDFNFNSLSKLISNQIEDYQDSIDTLEALPMSELSQFGLYIQTTIKNFSKRNEDIKSKWLEENEDLVLAWKMKNINQEFIDIPKDIFLDFKDVGFAVFTKEAKVAVKNKVISVRDIAVRFAYSKNNVEVLKSEANIGMTLKRTGSLISLEEITVQY
jgi:hypothetical protein